MFWKKKCTEDLNEVETINLISKIKYADHLHDLLKFQITDIQKDEDYQYWYDFHSKHHTGDTAIILALASTIRQKKLDMGDNAYDNYNIQDIVYKTKKENYELKYQNHQYEKEINALKHMLDKIDGD